MERLITCRKCGRKLVCSRCGSTAPVITDQQIQVYRFRRIFGFSEEETARLLGITQQSVSGLYTRLIRNYPYLDAVTLNAATCAIRDNITDGERSISDHEMYSSLQQEIGIAKAGKGSSASFVTAVHTAGHSKLTSESGAVFQEQEKLGKAFNVDPREANRESYLQEALDVLKSMPIARLSTCVKNLQVLGEKIS